MFSYFVTCGRKLRTNHILYPMYRWHFDFIMLCRAWFSLLVKTDAVIKPPNTTRYQMQNCSSCSWKKLILLSYKMRLKYLPHWWPIGRHRWIPRTNDQLRGKCFHLMTSSRIQIFVIFIICLIGYLKKWTGGCNKIMFKRANTDTQWCLQIWIYGSYLIEILSFTDSLYKYIYKDMYIYIACLVFINEL